MKQIKKSLSIFMAALFVMAGILGNITAKAAVAPTVGYVGLGHAIVAGDTRTFSVTTANYVGNVEYRAFISYNNHNSWTEITKGYTVAADGKATILLPATGKIALGNYRVSVWVKAAGTTGMIKTGLGSYDSYKVSRISCTNKIGATITASQIVGSKTPMVGATEKYTVTSNFAGKVQYKAYLIVGAKITPLSNDYSVAVDSKTPYTFTTPALDLGLAKLSVWVKRAGENGVVTTTLGSYDSYAVLSMNCIANTAKTVDVFTTTVKPSTTGFGSIGNVTLTVDGVKNFATATQYQIFDGANAITAMMTLGTSTTIFPAKVTGNLVSVKLYNATAVLVKSIDVKLGEAGTIPVVVVVPPVEAVVNATVKPSTTGFGSIGNVTSTQVGAVTYQLFDGANAISAITALGTATTVFPGKLAGQQVTVQLFNAAGTVIATKTLVTLVAAK